MTRPSRDAWAAAIARVVATRSTCVRRAVGCVLTDSVGRIVATGYNGRAAGLPHCNDGHPCPAVAAASGVDLDGCEAIHAEQNALLQCGDVDRIAAAYVTTEPCVTCVKLFLNTPCRRIFFDDPYAANGRALWRDAGRWMGRWIDVDRLIAVVNEVK
jgi:dCMP deaminase